MIKNCFLLFLKIYDNNEEKVVLCIGKEQHDAAAPELYIFRWNNNFVINYIVTIIVLTVSIARM